jgi:FMN-dependent NADH-azoreductase
MKLLQIDSSARLSSVSRELTAEFTEEWKRENPGGEVVARDLAKTPLPLITDEWTSAIFTDPSKLTPEQREVLAISDTLIAELFAADTIVIGVPMYNFTLPWPLRHGLIRSCEWERPSPMERRGLRDSLRERDLS